MTKIIMNLQVCSKYFLFFIALFCSIPFSAQKKVLDHSVYDSWKGITQVELTNDGRFSVAVVTEQEGNDYLLVKNLQSDKELILRRGYKYTVTPDQKRVIAQIKAPFAATRQAKIKKTADEKMPKDSLAIISLDNFAVTKIPSVKDFKLGKDFSEYVAYTLDDTLKVKDKKEPKAYSLVIRNLSAAKEDTIKNVVSYAFSRNGKGFSAIMKPSEKDSINPKGVLYINLDNYDKKIVSVGQTDYKNLSLSESGTKLAFLATADSLKKEIKEYKLYGFDNTLDSARLYVDKYTGGMPANWNVSENYTPVFSKNEQRLLLGTAPIVLPKDTTVPDFEKAQLDIWHWQEPDIQPKQKAELQQKMKQTYLAYLDWSDKVFHQLATEEIPDIRISDENNGRYAIGLSNLNSVFEVQWDIRARTTYDIWVFDLESHSKTQIKTGVACIPILSPQGNYLAWYDFDNRQYHAYSMQAGKEAVLTNKLSVNFWDEKYDQPSSPDAYGFAAWIEGDESLWVYDAYDIWKLDPKGNGQPENVTKGEGRDKKITYRYIKTDPESRFIKKDENILLSAFDNTTKEHGFAELKKGKLNTLVIDKYTFPVVAKAKDKNVFVFVKNNFNTSPDLYLTTDMWKSEKKLSDVNPQMRDYNWGTAELVSWTTFDGKPTQGILYKPEDFDPDKKYPVMIYFYEKHADNLYQYFPPAPSRSIINIPFYCSRGYIVFTPDIQYTTGHPGQSAYNSVVSGAEMLTKEPWVDRKNMAIQGQSWGGYQVAYLVTRTDMFKAAGSGAPVSNMFSAYGGIRWETGRSRQYQYEQTQSRIGATMWEAPELYKENSPVFYADKVKTPLLIMHNDNDGAVPWYQGIEYFMALRRLGKPVWMLQYNNEAHNLKERRNTKDLSIRLQQFFDHYLKGDPMPVWMTKGVPAKEKGKTYGLEFE